MNESIPSANSVIEVFNEARSRPAGAEREQFLAQACGADAKLRAEVDELLGAREEAGSFLKPVAGVSAELEAEFARLKPEEAGERIGPYKLREQIGEGGFGTVWVADQEKPVRRRVALKIIKMGMDTKEVIARFEQERQALAMMDHPNIAQVFDAGATQWGRPFFVMELVKGMPITQYCDEAGLGTRERLALFGDVCSAINHAHQKGVIHRDIKPSNVMVTLHGDKPVVKVIDFGIAKATQGRLTDHTVYTQFEQMVGTPAYMSPEQAGMSGLDVDTRSDIYALGVLLYELLIGRPPFDGKSLADAGYEEMRRIIREVEPVKPSSRLSTIVGEERTLLAKSHRIEPEKIGKLVEPDLDWIVMKAIDKDRARRYETANAFAQDIRRFLADEPVSATPPSAGYQLRKFARRNKTALRVAAGIAVLLVAATIVSSSQAIRATQAEKLATQRLTESQNARATAEASEARAEEARKDAEAIAVFLTGMFQSARPGDKEGGRDVKVVDVLDSAANSLKSQLADQPDRRAKLRATLGETYWRLGLYREAIPLLEEAHDDYKHRHGPEYPGLIELNYRLAKCYGGVGRKDEEVKMVEELLDLSRKVHGPTSHLSLSSMQEMALVYDGIGSKEKALAMRKESLHTCEEMLAQRRQHLGPEHPNTLRAMGRVGDAYNNLGLMEEALKMREELLALSRKVNGPEHINTLGTIWKLSNSYTALGRKVEALALREEQLELNRKVRGPENLDTLSAMSVLAESYRDAGRSEEALTLLEQVLQVKVKVFGPEHPETRLTKNKLAGFQRLTDQGEDTPVLRRIDEMGKLADSHALWNTGHRAGRKGDWVEAAKALTLSIAADIKVLGNHVNTLRATSALIEAGDIDGYRRLCASLSDAVASARDSVPATCLGRAGLLLPETGFSLDECRRLADLAAKDTKSGAYLWFLGTQALSEYRCGRFENAVKVASECLADPRCPPGCRPLASPVLAMAHYRAGRTEVARAALQAAAEDLSKGWFSDTRKDLGDSWHDWLIGHILLREARGLIEGTAPAAPQAR